MLLGTGMREVHVSWSGDSACTQKAMQEDIVTVAIRALIISAVALTYIITQRPIKVHTQTTYHGRSRERAPDRSSMHRTHKSGPMPLALC